MDDEESVDSFPCCEEMVKGGDTAGGYNKLNSWVRDWLYVIQTGLLLQTSYYWGEEEEA